jgi:hypothetical protein
MLICAKRFAWISQKHLSFSYIFVSHFRENRFHIFAKMKIIVSTLIIWSWQHTFHLLQQEITIPRNYRTDSRLALADWM